LNPTTTGDRSPAAAARPAVLAVLSAIGLVLAGLLWTCLVLPFFAARGQPRPWLIPGDVWIFTGAADYVAAGALPFLYEADRAFVYPPGLAILLAPVCALGRALQLSTSTTQYEIARPALWFPVAIVGIGTAALPVYAAARMLVPSRLSLQAGVSALVALALVPAAILYGHFEEVVVAGCLLLTVRLLAEERYAAGAAAFAVALLFKQTAFLAAPLLWFQLPGARRARAALLAVAPVAALCAICLAVDWKHASAALLASPSAPGFGHAALWYRGGASTVATPMRIVAVLVAVGAGLLLRRRRSTAELLAALALIMLIRLVTEPVVFSYYLTVPGVLALVAAGLAGAAWRAPAVAVFTSMAAFLVHGSGWVWWSLFLLPVLGIAASSARLLTGPRPETPATAGTVAPG
jgi:hypothetical protein